jgi:hypothetical protein
MLLKPEGLIPDARRARELHHEDEEPITDVAHVAIAGGHE